MTRLFGTLYMVYRNICASILYITLYTNRYICDLQCAEYILMLSYILRMILRKLICELIQENSTLQDITKSAGSLSYCFHHIYTYIQYI